MTEPRPALAAIIAPDSLYQGYLDARRHKRGSRACLTFEKGLGQEIATLHQELVGGHYRPRPYHHFWVYEPKPRQISAPDFRDRVVQHAIYRQVLPHWDPAFIATSFACRPGKGTHAAADYVQAALRHVPADSYVLQLDIRRYYYRIQHAILRALIARRIHDPALLDLWMAFAEPGDGATVGLPIGCLLSQLNGLIYLNPLDHFIKRDLKIRYYARYVDDLVLIGVSRAQGQACQAAITAFLRERLGLELSRDDLYPSRRGVNFVGYRTWRHRRFVRKHSLYTFRRAAQAGDLPRLVSCIGHARRTATWRHYHRALARDYPALATALPPPLRRDHESVIAADDASRRPPN